MADKIKLNKTNIKNLQPVQDKQCEYWDSEIIGFGIRVSAGGSKTFFFQGRLNGRVKKYNIGRSDKVTPETARKDAKRIQSLLELNQDPAPKDKKTGASSLGDLMNAYVDLLEHQGKISHKSVNNQIQKDIKKSFPKLWKKAANQIDIDDCVKIVGKLTDEGKPRQADKIRSYLRTAYSEAINSRGDVNMPKSMRSIGVTSNPARDMRKVKGSSQARDRALSLAEFRAYWKHVQKLDEPRKSVAILHVLTGGQRQQQLGRATLSGIDKDTQSLTIADGKGRRTTPRRHVIPLLPSALKAIERTTGSGEYIFSCDGGKKPMGIPYINDIAKSICQKMKKAGELEGTPFTAGTIRATIETRLIAKPYSVSSDVLGHLLSHGMGGIQQRHYQHHSFFEEKLDALNKLQRMLTEDSKVVPMRERA